MNRDDDRAVTFNVNTHTKQVNDFSSAATTGDWNYQHQFSQSCEVREHFSQGSDHKSGDFPIMQALASPGGNYVLIQLNCILNYFSRQTY